MRTRRQLPFPATSKLRIAQISLTAHRLYSAAVFPFPAWNRLANYRPQVLMGSAADLRRLSEMSRRIGFDPESVDRAILVLSDCKDEPVNDISRVVLWQAFGVPIYELIIAAPGLLLASECVAHEGWHLEPGITASVRAGELFIQMRRQDGFRTGLSGELVTYPCPCGRPGMRVMNIALHTFGSAARRLAATA